MGVMGRRRSRYRTGVGLTFLEEYYEYEKGVELR